MFLPQYIIAILTSSWGTLENFPEKSELFFQFLLISSNIQKICKGGILWVNDVNSTKEMVLILAQDVVGVERWLKVVVFPTFLIFPMFWQVEMRADFMTSQIATVMVKLPVPNAMGMVLLTKCWFIFLFKNGSFLKIGRPLVYLFFHFIH